MGRRPNLPASLKLLQPLGEPFSDCLRRLADGEAGVCAALDFLEFGADLCLGRAVYGLADALAVDPSQADLTNVLEPSIDMPLIDRSITVSASACHVPLSPFSGVVQGGVASQSHPR